MQNIYTSVLITDGLGDKIDCDSVSYTDEISPDAPATGPHTQTMLCDKPVCYFARFQIMNLRSYLPAQFDLVVRYGDNVDTLRSCTHIEGDKYAADYIEWNGRKPTL